MAQTKNEKKASGLMIDDEHDFVFIKKWTVALRWLMVIPVGIVVLLIMKLTLGSVANRFMTSFNIYLLNVIIAAFVSIITYMVMTMAMIATVPMKNKTIGGLICAAIPLAVLIVVSFGLSLSETPIPAKEIYLQLGAGTLGIIWALYNAKTAMADLKKKQQNEVEVISPEPPVV